MHVLEEKPFAGEVDGSKKIQFSQEERDPGEVREQDEERTKTNLENEQKQILEVTVDGVEVQEDEHDDDDAWSQTACSTMDTNADIEVHMHINTGGKDFDQPISSNGGYNLDFLEEIGADAANLCPTSPLVTKERKRSPAKIEEVVHCKSEAEIVCEDVEDKPNPENHANGASQLPNDEAVVLRSSAQVDPFDQPIASKGYNIDFLAEDLNAEDLDPDMLGKSDGIQNSSAGGPAPSKARKLVKPWMRKKAQKTPLPPRTMEEATSEKEEDENDSSPFKPVQMEEISLLKETTSPKHCLSPLAPLSDGEQETRQEIKVPIPQSQVLGDEGTEKVHPEEVMAVKAKPRLIKKSKSVVSFKEVTEEIPESPSQFDSKSEWMEKSESVLDSTITLEEPKIGNLLPGFDLPVISLVEEAQLLEKDKALAVLVGEVEDKQEEEEMLQEELNRTAASNKAMVHVVGEYEKTIEQLVQERTKEKSHLLTQAEEKVEEVRQVRIEIEDVKRASKDLTKKYSRTREAISGYITAEAELKGEVESLVGRVSVRLSFKKVKMCYR